MVLKGFGFIQFLPFWAYAQKFFNTLSTSCRLGNFVNENG